MNHRLLAVFSVLWSLDTLFTTIFVSIAGISAEANPVMQYVMTHLGLSGFAAVKMLVLAVFAYAMHNSPHTRTNTAILGTLNLIMLYVVIMGGLMVHLVSTTNL